MGNHTNKELQGDWNTLGTEYFEFSILDELKPKEISTALEIKEELKDLLELHRNDLLNNGETLY